MLALLATAIIVLLAMAQFYLKSKTMTSFGTMMAVIFGFMLAFSYYEPAANFLVGKGYGGQWAQAGIFVLFFVVAFAVFRTLTDVIWDPDADFGGMVDKVAAVVCGLITGLIISGVVLVAVAMMPSGAKLPYARFGDGQTAISDVRSSKKPPIAADSLVSGLFSWMSKGSMSSSRSFAVYHAGYLDQLHLNRYKTKAGVYRIAGQDAINVPKKGLRRLDAENESLTIVRMEVKRGDLKSGGASNPDNEISFMLGQVRLVCKRQGADNTRGAGTAIYPEGRVVSRRLDPEGKGKALTGLMAGRVVTASTLDEVVTLDRDSFSRGGRSPVDLVFRIPEGMTPVVLQFKDNVVVSVGAVEAASEETEAALRGDASTTDAGDGSARPRPGDPNS